MRVNLLQACDYSATLNGGLNAGVVAGLVNGYESRYFSIDVKVTIGMKLNIITDTGSVVIYVSKTARTPSQDNYNFQAIATPNSLGEISLSPEYFKYATFDKARNNGAFVPLYMAVLGLGKSNNFSISYDEEAPVTISEASVRRRIF